MGLRKFLLLLAAGVISLVALAAWFLPLDEDFRVGNPFWNGSEILSTSYPAQPLESFTDLPPSPRGTTLILIPYLSLTLEELEQLSAYTGGGGRLILADDYGHGNQILEHLGLEVRFSGEVLLDPLLNYKTGYFPRIIHLEPDLLTIGTESLVLNHATCLTNTGDEGVIALSSSFSFLDRNENGIYEDDETAGPLPVICRKTLGAGQLVLVADPSLFINSMNSIEENEGFIRNIADTTTSLYIDQSHLPLSDLHQTKTVLAQGRERLSGPLATAGLVALTVVITLKPVWYRKKERQNDA